MLHSLFTDAFPLFNNDVDNMEGNKKFEVDFAFFSYTDIIRNCFLHACQRRVRMNVGMKNFQIEQQNRTPGKQQACGFVVLYERMLFFDFLSCDSIKDSVEKRNMSF